MGKGVCGLLGLSTKKSAMTKVKVWHHVNFMSNLIQHFISFDPLDMEWYTVHSMWFHVIRMFTGILLNLLEVWCFTPSCLLFSNTYIFNPTTVQLHMFCFSVFQILVEFHLKSWGGVVSWLWRYNLEWYCCEPSSLYLSYLL